MYERLVALSRTGMVFLRVYPLCTVKLDDTENVLSHCSHLYGFPLMCDFLVSIMRWLDVKAFVALVALVWPFSCVYINVPCKVVRP